MILGGFCFGVLVGPMFGWVGEGWLVGSMGVTAVVFIIFPLWQRGEKGGSAIPSSSQTNVQTATPPNLPFERGGAGVVLVLLLSISFGVLRYNDSAIPSSTTTIADRTGQTIRIEGVIAGEVEQKLNGQQVTLKHLRVADEPVDGKLLVGMSLYPHVRYGDELQISCRPEVPQPFNGFAYDRYLASRGILATCSFPQFVDVQPAGFSIVGTLLALKSTMVDRLQFVLAEPHASFLSGLLFGGGSSLSRELQEDFSQTGTSHILAASGFNVSLFSVAFLGWILTTRLKRSRALSIAGALLVVYLIVAGAVPAVVRATIMASLVLVQQVVRREPSRLNLLLLAAAVMLLANPRILLDDPGFQLSFAATAGILFLVPLWKDRFDFLPDRFGIRESFVASLVASLCTIPIMLWHFGKVSLIAPLVNLLILPLVPYAMGFTALAMVGGFIWIPLGQWVALPALGFSMMILQLITLFGSIL